MEKLTHVQIAKKLGWSRQLLEYYIIKNVGRVSFEKALAIQRASNDQIKAKDLCNGFRKTAKEVLKTL